MLRNRLLPESIIVSRDFLPNFLFVYFCWAEVLSRAGESFSDLPIIEHFAFTY